MKDSGVPWLKEIPVNWKVERGKNVLALQKRPVRDNDEVVTCFRDGEVVLRSLRRTEGFTMSDKEIGYQGINEGDIVIHGMDGFAGAMGVSKSTGKGSPVLIVCTPKYDAIPQYIIYYLRALAMTDVFVALATGIRERSCDLRWNKVSELEFIMPSSSEQQAIVEFLDRKCAEVDEMIALQEQIIEELKAYKQSVITEAVTKGLNPAAPMRDSGIEWIGSIPEHWEVSKVKWECAIMDYLREPISAENRKNELGLYDYYGASGVIDKIDDYNVDDKVLLIGEDGANLVMRNLPLVYKAEGKFWVNNHAHILKPLANNCYSYMAYMLEAGDYTHYITGSAQPKLSQDNIKNFIIPMPRDYTEQQAIADYLDEKCADIDSLIQTKQSKIDSLKEYKKSIIYEYVTGKRELNE
jgi:type I restriction enzyme S subunit